MALSKKQAAEYLLQMYQIRAFEEQAEKSYMAGKIHGTMHLSIGQEASAVGSISTLEPTDFIIGHHRGHGLCIAKGAELLSTDANDPDRIAFLIAPRPATEDLEAWAGGWATVNAGEFSRALRYLKKALYRAKDGR